MQKVIIAGSRNFSDYEKLKYEIGLCVKEPFILVSGMAEGADKLGVRYAEEKGFEVEKHYAKWSDLNVPNVVVRENSYGKYNAMAGHNRNKEMLDSVLANEDKGCVVAFWDGKSKGTKNMIDISQKAGIPVLIVKY